MKIPILNLTPPQFKRLVKNTVDQDWRIEQILDWVYLKKADSFEKFANIPKDLRTKLSERFVIRTLTIAKKEISKDDKTVRYLFKTADKRKFSAVFLPSENDNTVCISSQIGCPISCTFCSSGKVDFVRNLTRGEILEQVLIIENDVQEKISNVLFMGMGEPFLNYEELSSALKSLLSKKEFGIGKRHITVSTSGIVPNIRKLADENLGVRLAVSLHFTDDKMRKKMMPSIAFKIDDILSASRYYLKKTNARLTIEYILISGRNDSAADAHKLSRLLRNFKLANPNVRINLIAFNTDGKDDFSAPSKNEMERFRNILKAGGMNVYLRKPRGEDIGAACGQLK
jgi:23S rRNA (adenine2503-C2)-methyltransferase